MVNTMYPLDYLKSNVSSAIHNPDQPCRIAQYAIHPSIQKGEKTYYWQTKPTKVIPAISLQPHLAQSINTARW